MTVENTELSVFRMCSIENTSFILQTGKKICIIRSKSGLQPYVNITNNIVCPSNTLSVAVGKSAKATVK